MLSDAQHFADEGMLEMQIMNVQEDNLDTSKVLLPKVKNLISKNKDKRMD